MTNLGPNFYPKLVQISSELGMKPEDILLVMVSESGIDPAAKEKKYGASGLVQMMPDTLKGLKFPGTGDDFIKLSGEDQLDWVKKLIQGYIAMNGGPLISAAQYYVANFFPVALKLPGVRQGDANAIFIEKDPETINVGGHTYSKKYYDVGIKLGPGTEKSAYAANPGFRGSVPGAITYGDMLRQINKNKSNPLYQKAIAAMKESTNYVSGKDVAVAPTKTSDLPLLDNIDDKLDIYLSQIKTSEKLNRKLYKHLLPSQNIVIGIQSEKYTNAIEFSRILCCALDEELMATAFTHTDNHNIEVECIIQGPRDACFNTVKQLTNSLAEVFKQATIKIGGVDINTSFIVNKKSSYKAITIQAAQTQYRKFLLNYPRK